MSLTRKILLALAVMAALLVAAAAWLVATFDANRYKAVAVDWMDRHYQRRLSLGDVKLAVFPRLQVELHDVMLSEAGQPAERFAALADARLTVQWLPLLRRQLVVDEVQARNLSLRWQRDAQGRSNVDDLLRRRPPAEPGEPGESRPLRFDVAGMRFDALSVDIDDRLGHLRGQATLATLETGRLAAGQPTPVKLAAEARFTEPPAKIDLQGSTRLKLELGESAQAGLQVVAEALALQVQGDVPGVQGLDAAVEGSLAYRTGQAAAPENPASAAAAAAGPTASAPAAAVALEAAPLSIRWSLRSGSLQLQDSTLKLRRFVFRPDEERLDLDALSLQLKGALLAGTSSAAAASTGQGAQPLQFTLEWPQLMVRGQQLQGAALSGRFALEGPAALQGTLRSGPPQGSFARLRIPALELALGAATQGASASRVNGTLRTDLLLEPADRRAALEGLALDATVQNPALRPLAVTARGRVEASAQAAGWQLGGQMNRQAFDSDGRFTFGGARPKLQAQARFGELDLDALLPPRAEPAARVGSAPSANRPSGSAATDSPIDLSGLHAMDAQVSLHAGTLRYAPYVLRDLAADAVLQQGRLQVAPLRLRTWDGRVDARLSADAGANPAQQRVTVQASADDILIQALLQDVAKQDLLEGRGRLVMDLKAGGATVLALQRSLDGSAALQLRDGAVRGINLAQRLREVKAALSRKQDAAQAAQRTEKTDFSELTASFLLRNGVAENRDLSLKSPFLRLTGEGLVDLPGRRLDYTARTTVTSTSKGQGGAELDALRGLTIPIRLSGPFDAPDWQIRWSQVAAGAAGNLVKDQLQQKLESRAAEKLGIAASDAASAPLKAQVREAAKEKAKEKARDALKGRLEGWLGR